MHSAAASECAARAPTLHARTSLLPMQCSCLGSDTPLVARHPWSRWALPSANVKQQPRCDAAASEPQPGARVFFRDIVAGAGAFDASGTRAAARAEEGRRRLAAVSQAAVPWAPRGRS